MQNEETGNDVRWDWAVGERCNLLGDGWGWGGVGMVVSVGDGCERH